jgi:hypothetical protein
MIVTGAKVRSCRVASVAQVHTNAPISTFDQSPMTALIVESPALFPYRGKPNGDSGTLTAASSA